MNGFQDTLSVITALVAVAEFNRFVFSGGRPGRHLGYARSPAIQCHAHFDHGISPGVENFQRIHTLYFRHKSPSYEFQDFIQPNLSAAQ